MIFVTVGSQIPFDRLVRCIDKWAGQQPQPRAALLAQIGSSETPPEHIEWTRRLSSTEYLEQVSASRAVIAHAGMGTILTAIDLRKPILVMPRIGRMGETRNDHQIATARHLQEIVGLSVAWDESELRDWLGRLDEITVPSSRNGSIRDLTSYLKDFINRDS